MESAVLLETVKPTSEQQQQSYNIKLSDLCEDVILLICDHLDAYGMGTPVKDFSLVSRAVRELVAPYLFKNILISRPIAQLSVNPLISAYTRNLTVEIYGSTWWWNSGEYVSSRDAYELFDFIAGLERLRHLEVTMLMKGVNLFRDAFAETNNHQTTFIFPIVESLAVTPAAGFLVSNCPNITSLTIKMTPAGLIEEYTDMLSLLQPLDQRLILSANHNVTYFSATAIWSTSEVKCLIDFFPNIQHLYMRSHSYCYRAPVSTIIEMLSYGLKNLKTLALVKVRSLDMGYRPHWRGVIRTNRNPDVRISLWQANENQRVDIENKVVKMAFGRMDTLKECWIGEKRVARRLTNDTDGLELGELTWEWERKIKHLRGAPINELEASKWEKRSVMKGREICT